MNVTKIERVAVVAAAQNGAIGKDGWMPWELPEDLKRFKALTLGKPMIMGRVTFEAIGRPLPKRTTIVVTRDTDWSFDHENVRVCHTIEEAVELADEIAVRDGVNEVVIAGGAQIYHLALPSRHAMNLPKSMPISKATPSLIPCPPINGAKPHARKSTIRTGRITALSRWTGL